MARGNAVYICETTTEPGERGTDCPESLHNWPLPDEYLSAHEEASWRLRNGWSQGRRCGRCGFLGWRNVGKLREGQNALLPAKEIHRV